MANKKLTQLPELQSADVDGADIIPVVDDIGGTPTTKKVTITNLMSQAPVQQADIADFATQVSLGNVQVSLGNLQASLGTAATTDATAYGASISVAANQLKLLNPSGTQLGSDIDLSLYLDDTNLARITSGTLGANGIATFTRDDNSTFTIDLSNLTAVDSVNTQTGAVVLDADDIDDSSTAHKFVTSSDLTNLGNLSGTNTGDQDLSTYQLQPSEGAFANGDKTKLDGIEASADVTDATNVEAAGALMDSEVTNLADVKAFDPSDYATSAQGTTADSAVQPADLALTSLTDLTISNPQSEDVIKYNGSAWVSGQTSVDVDTPLNIALRGTQAPHLGAYPNQSFKVTDNPYKTVMVVADENGNLTFLLNGTNPNVFVKSGGNAPQALATGFSIQKDSTEPDIEAIDTDGTPYSVVSGDSDDITASGLPRVQGFNNPDIGAYSSPLLISGGTI